VLAPVAPTGAVPVTEPLLTLPSALTFAKRFASAHGLVVDDRDLHSHFDRPSNRWVFEWRLTKLDVDVMGKVTQQR
jgi:hypothetical protein